MKTGAVLLQELRYMLDEPTEVKWSNPALYKYLNDGVRQVNMLLSTIEQGWHVRVLNTASAPLSVYGVNYTPATALQVPNLGRTLTVPRDNMRIVHLYPELTVDRTAGYRFHPSNLMRFRFEQMALTAPASTDREYYYEYQGQTTLILAPALNQEMKFELHYVYDPSEIVGPSDVDQVPEWAYLSVQLYAHYLAYQAIAHPDTEKLYVSWDQEIKKLQQYANPRSHPQFPTEEERKNDSMHTGGNTAAR
jgi:hypothetical protein